jgi:hypothetical protein
MSTSYKMGSLVIKAANESICRGIIAVLLACLFTGFASCGPSGLRAQAASPIVSEKAAHQIAEKAFLDATMSQVTTYSIQPLGHTLAKWRFVIQGTGDFSRPGYHWLVEIDKATGHSTIKSGE